MNSKLLVVIWLHIVGLSAFGPMPWSIISAAHAGEGTTDAVHAAERLVDEGAKAIALTAWPSATYKRAKVMLPRLTSDGRVLVPIRFYCTSSWSGDEIWFELEIEYTAAQGITDVRVSDYFAVVPPFFTTQLTLKTVQSLAESGSQPTTMRLSDLDSFDGAAFGQPPLASMSLQDSQVRCGHLHAVYGRRADLSAGVMGHYPVDSSYDYVNGRLVEWSFFFVGESAALSVWHELVVRFGYPQSAPRGTDFSINRPDFSNVFVRVWEAGSVEMLVAYRPAVGDSSAMLMWSVERTDLTPQGWSECPR
jgi:hypothetical protein